MNATQRPKTPQLRPAVIESITRIHSGRLEIVFRVWRAEDEVKEVYANEDLEHFVIQRYLFPETGNSLKGSDVAQELLAKDRVSAVEWVNRFGNGGVIYREWP